MRGESIPERGARNLLVMSAGRVATHAVLILSALWIPRALGAGPYGQYAAVFALVQILVVLSAAGLPLVESRQLAPRWRQERSNALELASTIWICRLGLAGVAGVLASLWLWATPTLGMGSLMCLLIALLCASRAAAEATRSLFLAIGRAGTLVLLDLVRAGLTLPLVLAGFAWAGLSGVFITLSLLYVMLLATGTGLLMRAAPLRPRCFRFASLSPHLRASFAYFVGSLATIVQVQLSVVILAAHAPAREAGYLAFGLQFFVFVQGLLMTANRALFPLLAELESGGETRRLAYWGGLMMRYSIPFLVFGLLGWTLLGESLIRWTLTEAFLPVYSCGIWMLVAALFYAGGSIANGLLYIRGHTGLAALQLVAYAFVTLTGIFVTLLEEPGEGVATRISTVYALSSSLYFAGAHFSLLRASDLRLPWKHTLFAMSPALLCWPLVHWQASLGIRAGTLLALGAAGAALAARTGLVPTHELREIRRLIRGHPA